MSIFLTLFSMENIAGFAFRPMQEEVETDQTIQCVTHFLCWTILLKTACWNRTYFSLTFFLYAELISGPRMTKTIARSFLYLNVRCGRTRNMKLKHVIFIDISLPQDVIDFSLPGCVRKVMTPRGKTGFDCHSTYEFISQH